MQEVPWAPIQIRPPPAVLQVADDGVPRVRYVRPDLVAPPCAYPQGHEGDRDFCFVLQPHQPMRKHLHQCRSLLPTTAYLGRHGAKSPGIVHVSSDFIEWWIRPTMQQ